MSKDKKSKDENPIKKIAKEEKVKKDETAKKQEEGQDKFRVGVSYILPDESPVEMIYDEANLKTKLAVYKDGVVTLEDKIKIADSLWLVPLQPTNSLLTKNFILFPSEVGDYIDNKALYEEIRSFIDRYVELPTAFLSVATVYVMMSWLYDRFSNCPYLKVCGLYGTGKTRVLEVVGHLAYKSILAGGSTTPAALFRTLDRYNGSLIFDEADLSNIDTKDILQILRQGYNKNFPVTRMEPLPNGDYRTRTFAVFGPKVMASQSKSNDNAFESRCMTQHMYPVVENTRPIELSPQFKKEAMSLRNKLLMFRFRNLNNVVVDEKSVDAIKLPRLKQTGLSVVTIAKMVSKAALDDVVEFLLGYEVELGIEQADTVENDILRAVLDLLTERYIQESGKIRVGHDLAERFNSMSYEDYSERRPSSMYSVMSSTTHKTSPKKIGAFLRRMGIRVERDNGGFYILIAKEYPKIRLLSKRYGLEKLYTLPDDMNQIKEIKPKVLRKKKEEKIEKKVVEHTPLSDEAYKEIFGDDSLSKDSPIQS